MYCPKCEFLVQGTIKECPLCGGSLIEDSECEHLAGNPQEDREENLPETSKQETDSPKFDLESTLNSDDEKQEIRKPETLPAPEEEPPFQSDFLAEDTFDLAGALNKEDEKTGPSLSSDSDTLPREPELSPQSELPAEEGSTQELLDSMLDTFDPIADPVASEIEQSETVPQRSSKIVPFAALVIVLVIAVAAGGAFLLKSRRQPSSGVVLHKAEETVKTTERIQTISEPQRQKPDTIPMSEPVQVVQTAQQESEASVPEPEMSIQTGRQPADADTEPPFAEKQPPIDTPETVALQAADDEPVLPAQEQVLLPAEGDEKVMPPRQDQRPVTPAPQKAKAYTVHAGSFKTIAVAHAEADRLKAMGFNAYVQAYSYETGQVWYRVKIGDFSSRKEANRIRDELEQQDPTLTPYVMKRRPKSQKPIASKKTATVAAAPAPEKEMLQTEPETVTKRPAAVGPAATDKQPAPPQAPVAEAEQPVQQEAPRKAPAVVTAAPAVEEALPAEEVQVVLPKEPLEDLGQSVKQAAIREEPDINAAEPPEAADEQLLPEETSQQIITADKTLQADVSEKNDQRAVTDRPSDVTEKKDSQMSEQTDKSDFQETVYSISTASYKIRDIAINETIRWQFLGIEDIYIQTYDMGGGDIWYRVMIGMFASQEEAELVHKELKEKDPKLKSEIIELTSRENVLRIENRSID